MAKIKDKRLKIKIRIIDRRTNAGLPASDLPIPGVAFLDPDSGSLSTDIDLTNRRSMMTPRKTSAGQISG
jgi:hypothetical protein